MSPAVAQIQADRQIARCEAIEYAAEKFAEQVEYHADVLFDQLVSSGCMPHGFGSSKARIELCKSIAKEAVKLAVARANLPSGVVL